MLGKNGRKRALALLLAVGMVFAGGCGKGDARTEDPVNGAAGQEIDGQIGKDAEGGYTLESAKGRYQEAAVQIPDGLDQIRDMRVLSDGRLALFDGKEGLFLSEDKGATFEKKELPVFQKLEGNEFYITKAALAPDGGFFMEYYSGAPDGGDSTVSHVYVDADGNEGGLPLKDASDPVSCAFFSETGELFVCGADDSVYRIDPNGASDVVCQAGGSVYDMQKIGESLYLVSSDGLKIYELQKEEFTRDVVLDEFVREEKLVFDSTDTKPLLLQQGDTPDSLYIATSRGLFRHVVGGSVMEELIKGNLSSLGAPNFGLTAMASFGADHFLVCYNASCVKSYRYDAEGASVPANELSVYSLYENEAVGVAINLYREENPDIYINYEIGMSGGDGMTREDAIRNLNTAILSGQGPDVLVLDGLPIASYIEKGILLDIAPEIDGLCKTGDYYEKILKAFGDGGRICAVPAFYLVPVIVGQEGQGVTDLKSLADRVEELRREYPAGNIIESYREKEVLLRLYDIASPAIVKRDKSLDREMLTEYLTQAKRIWDAERVDMDQEILAAREEQDEQIRAIFGGAYNWYIHEGIYNSGYRAGYAKLIFGFYGNPLNEFADDVCLAKSQGQTICVSLLNGLAENVFLPSAIFGVSAAGNRQEQAKAFVESVLGEDVQMQTMESGFPVNRKAMTAKCSKANPGETLYSIGIAAPDGSAAGYEVLQPSEEEMGAYLALLEKLDTPADMDGTVKDAVIELGTLALRGEKGIEDAADEIINRVQIYLTE